MSTTGKGVFSLFKKTSTRESNVGSLHVRRSRSSEADGLSYLKPQQDISDRLTALENEERKKERKKKELEKKARNEAKKKNQRRPQKQERSREKKLEQGTFNKPGGESEETLMYTGKGRGTPLEPEADDDFKQNIQNLERQVENLDIRSKMMATLWISRLRAPTHNEDEIRARDVIIAHLLKCRNENIFQKEPFSLPPTSDTLANIQQKMHLTRDTPCHDMTLSKRMETKSYINKLFHSSYDSGKFLSQLPVPRDGAFFILHMRPNLNCTK